MSGQVLELLIFAGIAFFVISKLISVLGNTSEDDPSKNKSFFGENVGNNLKDVTPAGGAAQVLRPKFLNANKADLRDLVLLDNAEAVNNGLKELTEKMPSFNMARFISGARSAFKLIIEATFQNDDAQLEELIDKRYIESFKKTTALNYGNVTENIDKLSARISEIYVFGNNVFIKVLFVGNNITDKIRSLHEEWTFSRSALSTDSSWYLANIDSDNAQLPKA